MKIAVLGAGGFIGGHLSAKLKNLGHFVIGVDLYPHQYLSNHTSEFVIGDLRNQSFVNDLFTTGFDEVYQLAADMGGAGFIFTGEHDADIMHNSAQINLNVANALKYTKSKVFYSSSACIYPEENQLDSQNPICSEHTAFPANPDSEYGWEKLFSERLYMSYYRNYGLNIRIARFHNVFGPSSVFSGGREKAPAAICRKVAMALNGGTLEIWGSGNQTRSFLYIDECLLGIEKLMNSDIREPINIGSDELVSINELTKMTINISGKTLSIENIDGPVGVNGRCSDNSLIGQLLNWQPNYPLRTGMEHLYSWVSSQI